MGTIANDINNLDNDNEMIDSFDEVLDEGSDGVQEESSSSSFFESMKELLSSNTGDGEVDEYISHPLNFNKSKAMARIIRGLTGIFGNLKYAIIDVILGVIELSKEKKEVIDPHV